MEKILNYPAYSEMLNQLEKLKINCGLVGFFKLVGITASGLSLIYLW